MSERPSQARAAELRAVPLLDLITRQSLDEDYQHVAERRVHRDDAPAARGRGRTVLTIAAVVVFGLLVAVAAVQTSRNSSVAHASREQLLERIDARHATVAALQKQIARLRTITTDQESRYGDLGRSLNTATTTRRNLAARTGWGPVSVYGVRARVEDAPSGASDGEVRDSDLAGLVNGLWQAGATAIAVNGQRVTTLSALRNSGTVIRINDVSLSSPYNVLALGDTDTLQAKFAQSTSGVRFESLTRTYGMPYTMDNAQDLTLPAAPSWMLALRHTSTDHGAMTEEETP